MATEYGIRNGNTDTWWSYDRAYVEKLCRHTGHDLIAREVSDARLLSTPAH